MKTLPPMRFVLFSIAFVIVGVLPTFELTCPLDGGTGFLEAAQGLKVGSVEVKVVSEEEVFLIGECGASRTKIRFTYAVKMVLTNEGGEISRGTVSVVFNRHMSGQGIMVQNEEGEMVFEEYRPPTLPAYVSVAPGATRTVERVLSFQDEPFAPEEARHWSEVKAGEDMRDPTCDGTGKLSFVNWLRVKMMGPPSFE